MQNKRKKFEEDFLNFVFENFSDFQAPWRVDLRAAFLQLSLTETQIEFLLTPDNATKQFTYEFNDAMYTTPNKVAARFCLAAAFTEPVNKIASYLTSGNKDREEQTRTIQKAAAALPTLGHNLSILLGKNIPTSSRPIYKKISKFAQDALDIMEHENLEKIRNIRDLDGMHHVTPIPETLWNSDLN